MRILQVIASLAPRYGGPSVACPALARELARRGAEVTVFSTNVDGAGKLGVPLDTPVLRDGVRYEYFDGWTLPAEFKFSAALAHALHRRVASFDVVHIYSMYVFSAAAAARACRRHGVPYLLHPHGTLDPYLRRRHPIRKRIYEWLIERHNFRSAAAVLFNSTDEMRLAEEGLSRLCGRARIPYSAVIPVGVDDIWFAPPDTSMRNWLFNRFPELAGKRLVVFFGRLSFKKGLDVLARAFAELSRTSEDLHLVLAGPDSEGLGNRLREWFRQAQLLEKVTFTGLLDAQQGRALLATAEVFVLPSYSENFGQAVAEAMACGTPVVVSDRVSLHVEISLAKAGLVVPCNEAATAVAIEQILLDPALAREMGRRGRQCAREKFTWAVVGERMLALYRQIALRVAATQNCAGHAGCEQDFNL